MYSNNLLTSGKTHYDPFGMLLEGRNWEGGSEYRYGFNGKESDKETYGDGNVYDYGFRIYNSRLGKFLSVDPLFKSYAELTPYQFASNRPIDGIDLDGLEYITYIISVENNTGVSKIESIDFRDAESFNYAKYSQSYGPEGRGVKYIYNYVDENGTPTGKTKTRWAQEQGGWNSVGLSKYIYHGLFNGKGAISTVGPLFPIDHGTGTNTYRWDETPIDMPDAIAREHDLAMDVEGYQPSDWKDPENIFADISIVKQAELYLKESSSPGYEDPFSATGTVSD
ncbi:MAG TPA: RHS repeat-associated core domain-containing protein, partial [Chitinophagales bacterium]|nr:RHS repeat-associated core domain-containing protein [Chitinophagales bacterium]